MSFTIRDINNSTGINRVVVSNFSTNTFSENISLTPSNNITTKSNF